MTKPQSYRHHATVIEIYDAGLRAAVKFYCNLKRGERIECVVKRGTGRFKFGQSGMVDYVATLQGYEWVFTQNGV